MYVSHFLHYLPLLLWICIRTYVEHVHTTLGSKFKDLVRSIKSPYICTFLILFCVIFSRQTGVNLIGRPFWNLSVILVISLRRNSLEKRINLKKIIIQKFNVLFTRPLGKGQTINVSTRLCVTLFCVRIACFDILKSQSQQNYKIFLTLFLSID